MSHENVSLAMAFRAAFLFTPNRGVWTEEGSRHVGVVLRKASELPGSRGELYSPCHHLTHPFRNQGVEALGGDYFCGVAGGLVREHVEEADGPSFFTTGVKSGAS